MNVLLDITLFCGLLILVYWTWLGLKYLFAAGRWFGYWIGYRFIPKIRVKYNGVFVGRITQKEHDDMLIKIEEWKEAAREVCKND